VERHPYRQDQVLSRIPEEFDESFQPVTGAPVTLRPLRPEDVDIETAFVEGLSPETRANRLLGGAIRVTREYIERLTNVDYARDMALAATVMLDARETLIGVARYALEPGGRACEFALVVADAWQHRGIGRRLLEKLVAVARARRIERIYGDTLASNRPMIELARRIGFAPERHPEEPHLVRVTQVLRAAD
jgi:acetyltransferase